MLRRGLELEVEGERKKERKKGDQKEVEEVGWGRKDKGWSM